MATNKKQLPALFGVLLIAVVTIMVSANPALQAETAATPTLQASIWNYLPVVRGEAPGPTNTPAAPGPTVTPSLTPTSTATPTPTSTPQPGRLAIPTLFDILNEDNDGNFTAGWSTVPDAEYYILQQQRNGNRWKQVYEGPEREFLLSDLADGQYCYRVMALNPVTDSEWSATKCTTVSSATSTPAATSTTAPGGLAAPAIFEIANSDGDGNFTLEWSPVPDADEYIVREAFNDVPPNDFIVYRGPDTRLDRTDMAAGQYCYRVRAIILGGEWGPWSDTSCVNVNGAAAQISCQYETVGRIEPGIARHQMTYLPEMSIVVITGGYSLEWIEGRGEGEIITYDQIYVYDVRRKKLYTVGELAFPRAFHAAVPMGENNVLLMGGRNDDLWGTGESLPDEIVHIDREPGGTFRTYTTTREPAFEAIIDAEPIDSENALVVADYRVVVFDMFTGDERTVAIVELGSDYVQRMEPGSSKFLIVGAGRYSRASVVDIETELISSFSFPPLESEDYGGLVDWHVPELTALNEGAVLITNGTFYDAGEFITENDAFIHEGMALARRIQNTNYSLDGRVRLRTNDGYVLLIGGHSGYYIGGYSTLSEAFDPASETFYPIERPEAPHVYGEAVLLGDGSFLVSGGYDGYYYDYHGDETGDNLVTAGGLYDDYFWYGIGDIVLTTGGVFELVTCK